MLRAVAIGALGVACAMEPAAPERPGPGGGKADDPDGDRAGEVVAAIEAWNADLDPADRRDKYCKMAASPFAFFRGSNHLFWSDVAGDPRLDRYGGDDDTRVWVVGDLHPLNVGSSLDDEGRLVYGLNDFDESMIADYQYDLWRMAAGIALAGDDRAVDPFVESYLDAMSAFRGTSDESRFAITADNASAPLREFLDDVAGDRTRARMLERWTVVADGARRFDPGAAGLAAIEPPEAEALIDAVAGYGASLDGGLAFDPDHFRVLDVARRLGAGTGSLGVPRYFLLVAGPTGDLEDDVILDVKLQLEPTAARFIGGDDIASHAVRHALAVKALGVDTDDYLGILSTSEGDFSVRERSPAKDDLDPAALDGDELSEVAADWGALVAAAHARSDRDFDPAFIASSVDAAIDRRTDGEHAEVRALIRSFAADYAEQVALDHAAFVEALAPDCE